MKIILAGGTGTLGTILQGHFVRRGDDVVVLTRNARRPARQGVRFVPWNGRDAGAWTEELEHSDVVINLAGRSVDCRYTARNKALIRNSRIDATHALGRAIAQCAAPPPLWINLSTATIYRHAEDRPMDELSGEIGTGFSVEVARAWEQAFFANACEGVRQVAVRCAMVFSPHGGAFPRFVQLVRRGLGGTPGNGRQYVSWVHEADLCSFFQWLIERPDVHGVLDLSAPAPLPMRELMRKLRRHLKPFIALDTPGWMLAIGAFLLRTETELVLKSRRVVPTRALELGFRFRYPRMGQALDALFAPHTS